jgi:hypothetical protein
MDDVKFILLSLTSRQLTKPTPRTSIRHALVLNIELTPKSTFSGLPCSGTTITTLAPFNPFIQTGNQHIYFCPIYEEKTPSLKHCTCDEMHPTRKTFAVNFRICYNEVTGNHTY